MRDYILRRDNFECMLGGEAHGEDLHIDHIWPRTLGGDDTTVNLWVLCARCNLRKAGRHPMEWLETLYQPVPLIELHIPQDKFWFQIASALAHAEFELGLDVAYRLPPGRWDLTDVQMRAA